MNLTTATTTRKKIPAMLTNNKGIGHKFESAVYKLIVKYAPKENVIRGVPTMYLAFPQVVEIAISCRSRYTAAMTPQPSKKKLIHTAVVIAVCVLTAHL